MSDIIIIGSDHGGFEHKEKIKEFLDEKGYTVTDVGPDTNDSCDYPDFAKALCKEVLKTDSLGILICGTGIGMSITANKVKGIDAAVVYDNFTAKSAKEHNNANVICFGQRTQDIEKVKEMIDIFLNTNFEGDRHVKRIDKIRAIENEQ